MHVLCVGCEQPGFVAYDMGFHVVSSAFFIHSWKGNTPRQTVFLTNKCSVEGNLGDNALVLKRGFSVFVKKELLV